MIAIAVLAGCATEQGIPGGTSSPQQPIIVTTPSGPPPADQPAETPPLVTRPPTQTPPPGGYPKSLKASGAGPGVLALAKQAQESRTAGKYDAAIGQLERALRIEPKNPFVWQAIAETHLQLQHADQAESAAQKSTSLGRGNPYLEAGNWRLIAAARQLKGDSAGAMHATSRADALSSGQSSITP